MEDKLAQIEHQLAQIKNQTTQDSLRIHNSLEAIRYRQDLLLKVYQDTRFFDDRKEAFEFYKAFTLDINSKHSGKFNVRLATTTEISRGDETKIQQSIDIHLLNINNNNFNQEYLGTISIILNTLNQVSSQLNSPGMKNSSGNTHISDRVSPQLNSPRIKSSSGNTYISDRRQKNPLVRIITDPSFLTIVPFLIIVIFGVYAVVNRQNNPTPQPNRTSAPATPHIDGSR